MTGARPTATVRPWTRRDRTAATPETSSGLGAATAATATPAPVKAGTPTLVVALTGPTATSDDWIVVELTGLGVDPSPGSSFLLSASLTPP